MQHGSRFSPFCLEEYSSVLASCELSIQSVVSLIAADNFSLSAGSSLSARSPSIEFLRLYA